MRNFHVAVVQQRLRNVQKSLMHVQSCCCCCFFFAHLNLLFICCSPSPLQKLPIVVIQKFCYHGNATSHFSSLLNCNLFTHGLNVSVCSRSNWNLRRGGKPMMNLEKKLSEQGREQATNSTHIMASTAGCVSALTTAPPLLPINLGDGREKSRESRTRKETRLWRVRKESGFAARLRVSSRLAYHNWSY